MNRVHLTDFGLAKATETGSKYTRSGQALGTPAYMAPEQARGEDRLTPAADVWSLGCLLYELLAGRRAFETDSSAEVLAQLLAGGPPSLAHLRTDIPRALHAVLHQALAPAVRRRYAHAGALRDELDRVLVGAPVRAGRRARRRVLGVAALVALAAGGVAVATRASAGREAESAEALAQRADVIGRSAPAEAAALLASALARVPDRQAWRIARGTWCWCAGDAAGARAEWGRVPVHLPEGPLAGLYLGLEAFLRLEGREAHPHLVRAAAAGGRVGMLARAAAAAIAKDWAAARGALAGQTGWEAALLRGYVETIDDAGDARAAVRACDETLAAGIALPWVYNNRGNARHESGDDTGALADYDAALRLEPGLVAALINRAGTRRRTGDAAGALADADAALARSLAHAPDPGASDAATDTDSARHERARALVDLGRHAEAVVEYGHRLAGGAADADLWAGRADARRLAGDLLGARADYDHALRLQPEFPEALLNRGRTRHEQGDLEGARGDFDAALALRPEFPITLDARAEVRADLGDLAGALADHDAAVRLDPDQPAFRYNRGCFRQDQGDGAGAWAEFDAVLARHPGFASAHARRGRLRARAGDLAGALADFDAVVQARPGDGQACSDRGVARQHLGDLAGALEDFDAAVAAEPGDPDHRANRAVVRRARGDLDGAEADCRAALAVAPDHAAATLALADVAESRQDWAAMAAGIRRYLALVPDDPNRGAIEGRLARAESRARDPGGGSGGTPGSR